MNKIIKILLMLIIIILAPLNHINNTFADETEASLTTLIKEKLEAAEQIKQQLKQNEFSEDSSEYQAVTQAINDLDSYNNDIDWWGITTDMINSVNISEIQESVTTAINNKSTYTITLQNQEETLESYKSNLLENGYTEDSDEIKNIDTALDKINSTQENIASWWSISNTQDDIDSINNSTKVAKIYNDWANEINENNQKIAELTTQEEEINSSLESWEITEEDAENN